MTIVTEWQPLVAELLEQLARAGRLDDATVLLVGSVARHAEAPESDIDIVIVGASQPPRTEVSPKMQVLAMTRAHFIERLERGDDFPHWVVKFGKVLSDGSNWWQRLLREPAANAWPDWTRKLHQAAERLSFASRLHAAKDYDHAVEEYLLSARHLARGVLLKDGTFPFSQPELPKQLRTSGYPELADLLDLLIDSSSDQKSSARAEPVLSGLVNRLKEEAGVRPTPTRSAS